MKKEGSLQTTLKALADPTRREILEILKPGRLSAGDIGRRFNITAAAISRHLSVLKDADLIRDEREGKFIFYEINLSILQEILVWVGHFKSECRSSPAHTSKPARPGHQH